jgi:hypothetical protein
MAAKPKDRWSKFSKESGAMDPVTHQEAPHVRGPVPNEVTFHIAVNGEAEVWHDRKISYEEVVKLAFPDGPHGGDIRYSVTWIKPDGQEGSLRPNHSVDVVDRMKFHVRNTDKS